jgi:hypothetical protein
MDFSFTDEVPLAAPIGFYLIESVPENFSLALVISSGIHLARFGAR